MRDWSDYCITPLDSSWFSSRKLKKPPLVSVNTVSLPVPLPINVDVRLAYCPFFLSFLIQAIIFCPARAPFCCSHVQPDTDTFIGGLRHCIVVSLLRHRAGFDWDSEFKRLISCNWNWYKLIHLNAINFYFQCHSSRIRDRLHKLRIRSRCSKTKPLKEMFFLYTVVQYGL